LPFTILRLCDTGRTARDFRPPWRPRERLLDDRASSALPCVGAAVPQVWNLIPLRDIVAYPFESRGVIEAPLVCRSGDGLYL